jgi:pSer/pThr/pTyr-binding forkhead associated (FHA) protein/tetratricopeptide (TPR) repeat protein
MSSDKQPLGQFFLATPDEDDEVYEGHNATTVDDSYLSGLQDRLAKGDGKGQKNATAKGNGRNGGGLPASFMPNFMGSGSDLLGKMSSGNPQAISSANVPRVEVPVSTGHQHDNDIIELESDALEPIDDDDDLPGPSHSPQVQEYTYQPQGGQEQPELDAGPLRPGPSDLLQAVPPPPDDFEPLDPELNPATYDAPTFVRPSLIDQDPVPIVEIMAGNEKGRSYRFERDYFTIGRGLDNDVVLTDIAVSRKHVKFTREGNEVTLNDLGSGNGTVVNGGKVRTGKITPADRIEVGNTIIRIIFPGQESFPPQPMPSQPVAAPSGPLHHKSTMHLGNDQAQHLMHQIGVVQPGQGSSNVIVAGSQSQSEPTPSASYPNYPPAQPQPQAQAQAQGVPRSFKIAMVGLMVLVVLISIVAFFAALSFRQNLDRVQQPVAVTEAPSAEMLFNKGRVAYMEKRWGQAADDFEGVLALTPENTDAQNYLKQSRAEQRNQGSLVAAEQALNDNNFDGTITTLGTIPSSSVYYGEAMDLRTQAQQRQSEAKTEEARQEIASGNSNSARDLLREALALNQANSPARDLLRGLDEGGSDPGSGEPRTDDPGDTSPRVTPAPGKVPSAPVRPPPSGNTPPRPSPAPRSNSRGLNNALSAYKSGRFDQAIASARETAAATSNSSERQKARNMASQIERFSKAWNGANSGGNAQQKLNYLESALRLDGQISGGHYAGKIRPKLLELHETNAQRAWRAGQYASACQSAMRAQKIGGSSASGSMSQHCESKAREFFQQGEGLRASDINQAKSYWRKVLNMVPRDNPYYTKAYSALNNSGRGRYQDEDE